MLSILITGGVGSQGANVTFTCLASDLTSPEAVASVFADRFDAVYTLHGLMSGGPEANLELGLRTNLDSHRQVLDFLRKNHPGTVAVFPFSLAVYGPTAAGEVVSEATCPVPQSSYGAEKLIVETLINDYSRRGLLDGRVAPVSPDMEMWVCSPGTVVKNLIAIRDIPASKFGLWRTVNLPGITVP
ncbi:hypothetical protein RB596_005937 [Gaeumannomyces avenae]